VKVDSAESPAVLFVSLGLGFGGQKRSLVTVLRHLEGQVRRVLASPEGAPITSRARGDALAEEIVPLPTPKQFRKMARARAAVTLARWARRNRGDLVAIHANGLSEANVVALAARLSGTPLSIWSHDSSIPRWAPRLARTWRLLAPDVRFAAVSGLTRSLLEENGMAERGTVTIIPNPIDANEGLAERHSDPGIVTIAYVGWATAAKGFHLLPPVIRAVGGQAVRWMVFAEPRTSLPEVWAQLQSLSGSSNVELRGLVHDVRDAYARCDILFCPSLSESFGRTAAEAMLNGIPVVASDLPALREVVGEAGLFVPPGQVGPAAAALSALVADPARREAMGRGGEARASHYTPATVVASLKHLYGHAEKVQSIGRGSG
jgi:glycosyltransferase involved in cell wall biosynthesis